MWLQSPQVHIVDHNGCDGSLFVANDPLVAFRSSVLYHLPLVVTMISKRKFHGIVKRGQGEELRLARDIHLLNLWMHFQPFKGLRLGRGILRLNALHSTIRERLQPKRQGLATAIGNSCRVVILTVTRERNRKHNGQRNASKGHDHCRSNGATILLRRRIPSSSYRRSSRLGTTRSSFVVGHHLGVF